MDILRGGWAPGLLGNGAGLRADSPSTGGYATETEAIAAAFTTPPTTARKDLIDAAVVALKAAGVWTKLDALYAFAAADSQAAKINWINPGTNTATAVNSPTFVADSGHTFVASAYLDSNFNPATAPSAKYTLNDASIFTWNLVAPDINGASIGNVGNSLFILPNLSALSYCEINTAAGFVTVAGDGLGLLSGSRDSVSTTPFYKNGVLQTTTPNGTMTSVSVTSENVRFGMRQASAVWIGGTIAAGGFGGKLTAGEHLALYNALRTYLTGVGVP